MQPIPLIFISNVLSRRLMVFILRGKLMKKMNLVTALLLTSIIAAGCSSTGGQNQTGGTIVGGVAGALIGSQFGGGTGRVVGAAVGTLGGALIGSEVGKSMDNKQQQQERNRQQQRSYYSY